MDDLGDRPFASDDHRARHDALRESLADGGDLRAVLSAYGPSGRFSVARLPLLALGGVAGALIGTAIAHTVVAAALGVWWTFEAIGACWGLLLVVAFVVMLVAPWTLGFATGMGVRLAMQRARCRSTAVAMAVAVLVVVPACWAQAEGLYTVSGWFAERMQMNEGFLWVVSLSTWLSVALAPLANLGAAADEPFCEDCGTHVDEAGTWTFPEAAAPVLVRGLADGDRAVLEALAPQADGPTRVQHRACDCGALHVVDAHAGTTLVYSTLVTGEQAARLRGWLDAR